MQQVKVVVLAAGALFLCAFTGAGESSDMDGWPPSARGAQERHPANGASRAPAQPAPAVSPSRMTAGKPAPLDRRGRLEALFSALKLAPDSESAQMVSDRLDRLFADVNSPAIDLLMARAAAAMQAKEHELALNLLDQVLEIEPDALGARARRATLAYLRNDYGLALADIREVLAREPRHFTMLYALALILKEMGEDKLALEATRKALVVNPQLESAKDLERELTISAEGRQI